MNSHNIGIDLGGTRIKIGLVSGNTLLGKKVLSARSVQGLSSHLPLIDEAIGGLLQEYEVARLEGVSMAFPGLVNPHTKRVLSTNQKYDDAPLLDLEDYYRNRWNAAFFIDNDARMATVGEWKYGAGRGCDDLVMVTIGTGIGTSVIMQGKLVRGMHFQAGCLGGHFVVSFDGKPCTCGNIGCVEAEASTWNVASLAKAHPHFAQSSLVGREVDFRELFAAAKNGDEVAAGLREHCLKVWAAGIITYIHAYDPEMVILGGGILNSADVILPYIREQVEKHAWTPWGQVAIRVTDLQDTAGILGAVYCFQNNL